MDTRTHPAAGVFESPVLGRVHYDPRNQAELVLMHREIVEERTYLRHGIALAPGDQVVDAGANLGLFSLFADWACQGALRLLAFEPVPATFRFLEENAAERGLLGRDGVTLLDQGLTRIGGPRTAVFTVFPRLPSNSTLHPEEKRVELEAWVATSVAAFESQPHAHPFLVRALRSELESMLATEAVECRLTTLSAALREHAVERVDLLKVDVEGAELDVLDGLDGDTWPRIRQIVVETAGDARASEIAERLKAAGFDRVVTERSSWARELGVDNAHVYGIRPR